MHASLIIPLLRCFWRDPWVFGYVIRRMLESQAKGYWRARVCVTWHVIDSTLSGLNAFAWRVWSYHGPFHFWDVCMLTSMHQAPFICFYVRSFKSQNTIHLSKRWRRHSLCIGIVRQPWWHTLWDYPWTWPILYTPCMICAGKWWETVVKRLQPDASMSISEIMMFTTSGPAPL